jgi:hypothetical protein
MKRTWPKTALQGAYSLRAHLLLYGVIVALPLMAVVGFLLMGAAQQERSRLETNMTRVAQDLVNDIDRDIERRLAMLQALASSPSLASADWPAFYAQAKAAAGDGSFLILIDSSLRQLVNTYVPFGQQPATTGDPDTARQMLAVKQPQVSHLFIARVTGKPVFNINYPILDKGNVRYILILVMSPDALLPILQAQSLDERWFSMIVDQNERIVL